MRNTKRILFIIFLLVSLSVKATHPKLYITNQEKQSVIDKIANEKWAKDAWDKLLKEIKPYADRHTTDPEWIISRLAMYWKDGERYTQCYLKKQNWDYGTGNAPVPTVRMPGMRTWNEYSNVPLEDRIPYNETGDMWGISKKTHDQKPVLVPYQKSGHMIRGNNREILNIASRSAFIYFVTGEEKYARLGADIFYTWLLGTYYMNPILDPEKSSGGYGGWEPGGILGYYDYEQIHDDLAMEIAPAYDFLHDYLKAKPHPHLKETGKELTEISGIVFKRFIDLGMIRGGREGNWNVNGWNMMMRPILVLENNDYYPDGKGREHYLHYYTTESTKHHEALPEIVKVYDPVTGLWPESPGYALSTIAMLLEMAMPVYSSAGLNTIGDNPSMQKAAMAVFPWLDSRGNMVVFGDSRGGHANFKTFERLLTYYTWTKDKKNAEIAMAAINKGIETEMYNRGNGSWEDIILNVPLNKEISRADTYSRMAYSQFHRHITMKNGDDKQTGLMATLYGGTKGHHLTPNGLAMQLYGMGWALAPDASGYESYWSADMAYHQSATGCNTIIPGYTEGKITINAMEPAIPENSFVSVNEISPYCSFTDISAAEKRRLLAIIRTSASTGYYVDIFRSDLNDNDYIYHNLGNSMTINAVDNKGLNLMPSDIGKKYTKGYDYFTNVLKVLFNGDFKAQWILKTSPVIKMSMWMAGQEGRTIYKTDAPYSNTNSAVAPANISIAPNPAPTLIVRQNENNGWKNPFIAVFEPYEEENKSVSEITALSKTSDFTALQIKSKQLKNRTDYVLHSIDANTYSPLKNVKFKGVFGVISEDSEGILQLYLGQGTYLEKDGYKIESDNSVSASLIKEKDMWYYSSDNQVKITIDRKTYSLPKAYNQPVIK